MKLVLLSFILAYTLNINNKEIKGKIIDKNTSEELVGVMVIINQKDTIYTDLDGNFKLKNIIKITNIDLKYPSYTSEDIDIKIF